jgi:hypothetical protein
MWMGTTDGWVSVSRERGGGGYGPNDAQLCAAMLNSGRESSREEGPLTPAPIIVLTRLTVDDDTVAVTRDASIFSPSWNRTCVRACAWGRVC